MSDKLKSTLTNSYLMFIFEFADPSSVDKAHLSECIGCPVVDIFKTQRTADKSKKLLGKADFNKAIVCYFSQFQSQDGVNFKKLEDELQASRKVLLRHLGKDKLNYLSLMIKVSDSVEKKQKGLLGVAS